MSNQAIQLIQNRLGLQQLVRIASALDFQTNGAAAQGVDSGQAAQDLHASVQSANSKAPSVVLEGAVALVVSLIQILNRVAAVSYTHLTLPTKRIV